VKDPNLRDKSPKNKEASKRQDLYKGEEAHLNKHTRIIFGVLLSVFGGGFLSPLEGW
jgi:hypothetical protein